MERSQRQSGISGEWNPRLSWGIEVGGSVCAGLVKLGRMLSGQG